MCMVLPSSCVHVLGVFIHDLSQMYYCIACIVERDFGTLFIVCICSGALWLGNN
uniref:Uncharacterized protein n=1 Tax=Arundo donax TaxID=35708 RepID=A0A0A9FLG4_ARUDO